MLLQTKVFKCEIFMQIFSSQSHILALFPRKIPTKKSPNFNVCKKELISVLGFGLGYHFFLRHSPLKKVIQPKTYNPQPTTMNNNHPHIFYWISKLLSRFFITFAKRFPNNEHIFTRHKPKEDNRSPWRTSPRTRTSRMRENADID